jgi:thioredoxin 1
MNLPATVLEGIIQLKEFMRHIMNKTHRIFPAIAVFLFLTLQGVDFSEVHCNIAQLTGTNAIAAESSRADTKNKIAASTQAQLPAMIDLGKKQCVPCKMMAHVLEELQRDYTDALRIEFIDVGEKPDEARKYSIRGIPTQIFYDASGKERSRHLGYISKEQVLDTFRQLGVNVDKKPTQQK